MVLKVNTPEDEAPRRSLDRRLYAMYRARGFTMTAAALKAGSKAKHKSSVVGAARRMEKDPRVQAAIAIITKQRRRLPVLLDEGLYAAAEEMMEWLASGERELIREAATFFRRLAPKRVHLSGEGGGPVRTELTIPDAQWIAQFMEAAKEVQAQLPVQAEARVLPLPAENGKDRE